MKAFSSSYKQYNASELTYWQVLLSSGIQQVGIRTLLDSSSYASFSSKESRLRIFLMSTINKRSLT